MRPPNRQTRGVPPDRLGDWDHGGEEANQGAAAAAGGQAADGGQADQTDQAAGGTRLLGQFRPPFPPANFPVNSPVRLRLPVSPATPSRLPASAGSPWSPPRLGSPWSPQRLPGPPWSPPPRAAGPNSSAPRLFGLIRPPGLGTSPLRPASEVFSSPESLDLHHVPDLVESDQEGNEDSDDEESEGFQLNGSDSDYIEREDGPGIANGRTVRRSSRRPAGVGGQRAGEGVDDDGDASPLLLSPILLVREPPHQQVAAPVQQGGALPIQQAIQPGPGPPLGTPDLDGKEDLRPWLDPVVPGPVTGVIREDGDGWSEIDRLGVWDCGLSPFRALEDVPLIHREKWANTMYIILRRLQQANTQEEEI